MSNIRITFEVGLEEDPKVREAFMALMDRIMKSEGKKAVALTKETASEAQIPAEVTDSEEPAHVPLYRVAQVMESAVSKEPGIFNSPAKKDDVATLEQVREAMHRARARIEGDDWETAKATTAHTKLTAKFKEFAKNLGYEKPSAITDPHAREMFVRLCDCLRRGVTSDEIIEDLPY